MQAQFSVVWIRVEKTNQALAADKQNKIRLLCWWRGCTERERIIGMLKYVHREKREKTRECTFYSFLDSSLSGRTLSLLVERLTRMYSWPLECSSEDDGISWLWTLISWRETAVSNSLSLFSSWSESLSSSSLPILCRIQRELVEEMKSAFNVQIQWSTFGFR